MNLREDLRSPSFRVKLAEKRALQLPIDIIRFMRIMEMVALSRICQTHSAEVIYG